jgi:hypothetical protein
MMMPAVPGSASLINGVISLAFVQKQRVPIILNIILGRAKTFD